MQRIISNHSLENDLKSKSQFKNLISNRDFKSFDFKSYPTLFRRRFLTNASNYSSKSHIRRRNVASAQKNTEKLTPV